MGDLDLARPVLLLKLAAHVLVAQNHPRPHHPALHLLTQPSPEGDRQVALQLGTGPQAPALRLDQDQGAINKGLQVIPHPGLTLEFAVGPLLQARDEPPALAGLDPPTTDLGEHRRIVGSAGRTAGHHVQANQAKNVRHTAASERPKVERNEFL